MQVSGMCPAFSDGTKKTITTAPVVKAKPVAKMPAPASTHRRGGFGKHAKGGK